MTVYNGEDFLQEALDGIFSQSFKDFELVVVNNCSTDGTQAILDAVDDPRLRVINAIRHGSFCDGIRLAYKHARGKYIAVNDADDVSLPQRFARQVEALDVEHDVALVASFYRETDGNGVEITNRYPPTDLDALSAMFQAQNPLAHSTYMFRRIAAESVMGYPAQYQYGPDFGMSIRFLKSGWRIKIVDDVLVKIREHANQTSRKAEMSITRTSDALGLFQEAGTLRGIPSDARRRNLDVVYKSRLALGWACIRSGFLIRAFCEITRSILMRPSLVLAYVVYLGRRWVGGNDRLPPPVYVDDLQQKPVRQVSQSGSSN